MQNKSFSSSRVIIKSNFKIHLVTFIKESIFYFVMMGQFVLINCKPQEVLIVKENPPTVITKEANDISASSSNLNGEVLDEGFTATTDRGFVYSNTINNPSVSDSKVSSGYGKGTYSFTITNLQENTTYFYKSYATNSKGTSYGETKSFNTLFIPLSPPKDKFDYKNIIGIPLKVQNIEIAQYNFPVQLNWSDATKSCLALGKEWRLPSFTDWRIITSNDYVWLNTFIYNDYKYFTLLGPNVEPGFWHSVEASFFNAYVHYPTSNSATSRNKLDPHICRCVRNF